MIGQAPRHHLLDPAYRIETPREKIEPDRFPEPTFHAVAVLAPPKVAGFRVTQGRGIDMVETKTEERPALRRDEPPPTVTLRRAEKARRLRGQAAN